MPPEATQPIPTRNVPLAASPQPGTSVLVVRSDELRERIGAALAGAGLKATLEASPSYLSAMGTLVSVKPSIIIGPASAMTGMVMSTARALRKLCPAARLVVVARAHERDEAKAALDAGFDACVYEPATATQLLTAIGITQPAPPPAEEPTRDVPAPESAPIPTSTPKDTPADGSASAVALEAFPPEEDEAACDNSDLLPPDALHPIDEPPARAILNGAADHVRPARDEPPQDAPAAAQLAVELGDIDLVESLLQDDGSLPKQAQHLIAQQSGITEIALAMSAAEVNPNHTVVAVRHNDQQLGLLHAPHPATAQALTPWADWLARWLALDTHIASLRQEAMTDELTGIWNRRYFQRFLEKRLQDASRERQQVTLLLFDIDDFKQYNDNYGHPAGDDILQETARLIQSLVRDHDVVARIGGDEFAVVFWDKGEPRHLGSQHPDSVLGIARRFRKAISEHKFPKLGTEAVGTLTVSGGLATFPWDGRTPEELIAQADAMAIQSKRSGKNAVCFGPGCAPYSNGNGLDTPDDASD